MHIALDRSRWKDTEEIFVDHQRRLIMGKSADNIFLKVDPDLQQFLDHFDPVIEAKDFIDMQTLKRCAADRFQNFVDIIWPSNPGGADILLRNGMDSMVHGDPQEQYRFPKRPVPP